MANIYESNQAQAVTGLLKRIYQGEDPKLLRKQAEQFITGVHPEDIAAAKQNLINEGYSAQVVQQISARFMLIGIPRGQSGDWGSLLPANHLLRLVIVEHDLIRCFLADLNDVVAAIRQMDCVTDVNSEFRKLAHIIEHLSVMKEHIEREEDVIFPYLARHSWMGCCLAVQDDHIIIRDEIDNLVRMAASFNKIGIEQFKAGLTAVTQRLSQTMREHLFKEDEILYPIALGIVGDANVWERMKAVCDEIGYCGVHM
jgi:DUF438 domain-containing protein